MLYAESDLEEREDFVWILTANYNDGSSQDFELVVEVRPIRKLFLFLEFLAVAIMAAMIAHFFWPQ